MRSVFKRISSPISPTESNEDDAAVNNKKFSAFSMSRARTFSNDLKSKFTDDDSDPIDHNLRMKSRSQSTDEKPDLGNDENEDDDVSDPESVNIYSGDDQEPHKLNRKISLENANSIIGGSAVSYPDAKDEKNDAKETLHRENFSYEKSHKIFSFQLPFGGGLSFPRRVKIPFINSHSSSSPQIDEEIRLKLERNESISTLDEAKIFANYRGVDNSRMRAVKKALTPSIANDFKTYITNKERPDYESIYDDLRGDLVILGGYRGSILRDCKTMKRVWIPIKAGFNLRKIDLYIGPTKEDELNQGKIIKPDGMLTHIGPIDISRKFIKRLRMNRHLTVHEFGYDWRLSGHINAARLEELLTKIYKETGKGSYVVAHSMGGLIAHHVMNKTPELIRGICYAGVPSECPNVLGPIRFGDDVLLSDKILTAEVNFMMRSSFLFLPLSGELFVNRDTLEKRNLDYFDVNTWINYNLSPLVGLNRYRFEQDRKAGKIKSLEMYEKHGGTVNTYNNATDPVIVENLTSFQTSYEDSVEYLRRTLKETKEFLSGLDYDSEKPYPPLVVVYGNTIPSLRGSMISSDEDIKAGNWFDFFYGPGDGVVNQHWIMPSKRGFPVVARYASSNGHVALMTDLDIMGKALCSIVNEEKKRAKKSA